MPGESRPLQRVCRLVRLVIPSWQAAQKPRQRTNVVSVVPFKKYGGMEEFVKNHNEEEDPNHAVAAGRALAAAKRAAAAEAAGVQQQ